MTTVAEETSETLAGFLAGLNELRAQYPQFADPVRSCTCRSDDSTPCVAVAAAFPQGWMDAKLGLIGADALTHEQAHWEIVNGTPPPVHSMLEHEPGPTVLYAVRDDALQPLPPQPGHEWLDEMAAAFAGDDEAADAAVVKYLAIQAELNPQDDDEDGDESGQVSGPEPVADDREPGDDRDSGGPPFDSGTDGPGAA